MKPQSQILKDRKKNMVAKTFYSCGIVVPVNKKTKVGYRKIPETDGTVVVFIFQNETLKSLYIFYPANIRKICTKIIESQNLPEQNKNDDALQELVTYVQVTLFKNVN